MVSSPVAGTRSKSTACGTSHCEHRLAGPGRGGSAAPAGLCPCAPGEHAFVGALPTSRSRASMGQTGVMSPRKARWDLPGPRGRTTGCQQHRPRSLGLCGWVPDAGGVGPQVPRPPAGKPRRAANGEGRPHKQEAAGSEGKRRRAVAVTDVLCARSCRSPQPCSLGEWGAALPHWAKDDLAAQRSEVPCLRPPSQCVLTLGLPAPLPTPAGSVP